MLFLLLYPGGPSSHQTLLGKFMAEFDMLFLVNEIKWKKRRTEII